MRARDEHESTVNGEDRGMKRGRNAGRRREEKVKRVRKELGGGTTERGR